MLGKLAGGIVIDDEFVMRDFIWHFDFLNIGLFKKLAYRIKKSEFTDYDEPSTHRPPKPFVRVVGNSHPPSAA